MIMNWIFLSPHLDDVVFSCGGFIWDLTSAGQDVEIWTICAADPLKSDLSSFAASLHSDWGLGDDAYVIRRTEDKNACKILGASPRYLDYLDCIYRQAPGGDHYYQKEEDIFGGLDREENNLINRLVGELETSLPEKTNLVAPLGIGNHVDHELTRKAASRLSYHPYYYADYPYAREDEGKEILAILEASADWVGEVFGISDTGLDKWFEASQAYASQLSIFWDSEAALQKEIIEFSLDLGGMILWNTSPEE
jgi:LmbE family N-acetylglucosaminyl deacetylase